MAYFKALSKHFLGEELRKTKKDLSSVRAEIGTQDLLSMNIKPRRSMKSCH